MTGGLIAVFLLAVALASGVTNAREDQRIARVLNVRKVLLDPSPFFTRYPKIHSYTVYLSVRMHGRTYCADYETQVVQEVNDLTSSKGKDVEVVLNGKGLTVKTPGGRKLKAHLVDEREC